MKVRIPLDPCVRAYWELNRIHRPEVVAKTLAWAKENGIELEVE